MRVVLVGRRSPHEGVLWGGGPHIGVLWGGSPHIGVVWGGGPRMRVVLVGRRSPRGVSWHEGPNLNLKLTSLTQMQNNKSCRIIYINMLS